MSGEAAAGNKTADIRIMPVSLYVCRNPADGTATVSGSLAVGAMLVLRVEDAITGEPVAGAVAKRIRIDSRGRAGKVDWVDCDAEYHLPYPVPEHARALSAVEVKKFADTERDIENILTSGEDAQKAKAAELKALLETKQRLVTKDTARKAWVGYLQSGLKMLGRYDGAVDGEMTSEFAAHVVRTYKLVTGHKYDYKWAAKGIFGVIKKRYATGDDGCLPIPLPLGEKGEVEVEFLHLKVTDPADFAELGLTEADSASSVVYRGSGFSDPADQPGSTAETSAWACVTAKGEIRFRNFLKVAFDTPNEVPKEPVKVRTRALVWCQPVFTLAEKKFIWDPASGTRGQANRGTLDGRPTTLVASKAIPKWAKKYGEYGNKGRKKKEDGTWKDHYGIDLVGRVGDPVFAVNGGKVASTDALGSKKCRHVSVEPWRLGDPIPKKYMLLHLVEGSPTVKVGQIIKAGDIVGKMGRTGDFPGESPTHVHFQCGLKIDSDSGLDTFLTEGYLSVFPNNRMPKGLPCGQEYGNLDTSENAVGCGDAERADVANSCWALRELACPFLPADKSIKVKDGDLANNDSPKANRKIQAQLAKLFNEDTAIYADPGAIDGLLGTTEASVTVKSSAAHKTVWNATQKEVLFTAEAGEKFEQIELDATTKRHKVRLNAAQVAKYAKLAKKSGSTFAAGMIVFIHKSQVTPSLPGPTRGAVRKFRDAKIDGENKLDPPACYCIDQKVVDELEKLAPLKLETPA